MSTENIRFNIFHKLVLMSLIYEDLIPDLFKVMSPDL